MAKKTPSPNGKSLVIVESPAKARTISKFLGRNFTVEASIGHVRDLPQGAKEIPAQYKGEDWAYLGVNVDQDFDPVYIIPHGKSAQVRKLKELLKDSKDLYLATDEDREGEAISWHLNELLSRRCRSIGWCFTKSPAKRSTKRWSIRGRSTLPWFGAGSPADHRPVIRLRSFAAAVAQGSPKAFGRPSAKRGGAIDRRA